MKNLKQMRLLILIDVKKKDLSKKVQLKGLKNYLINGVASYENSNQLGRSRLTPL